VTSHRLLRLVPAVGGLLLAGVFAATAPQVRVYISVAPALLAGVVGVAATAGWLLTAAVRHRGAARQAADIEQVRAEGQMVRRRFVQRLDHELKNPLTALLTALAGRGNGPDPQELAVAHTQADRIRRLLTDLRRVADIETVPLDRQPIDIAALIREAVDTALADGDPTRHIRVDVPHAPWPLPTVGGDPDLLLIAVYNVLSNALKYTANGDIIEVRARESGNPTPGVTIEIADTGPGIAADEHDLIWEELARGRAATDKPGSGVGLALVRVILQRHGGTATVQSRLGHGTSIHLQLPTDTSPTPSSA